MTEDEAGYHIRPIRRGVFGNLSKLTEELEEAVDASEQGVAIMVLVELSDLYGAMDGYLKKHFPDMSMDDLKDFSEVTQRAFRNGHRTPK